MREERKNFVLFLLERPSCLPSIHCRGCTIWSPESYVNVATFKDSIHVIIGHLKCQFSQINTTNTALFS